MWTKEEIITQATASKTAARTEAELIEAGGYWMGVLRALLEFNLMKTEDYYDVRTAVCRLYKEN
jgi:hypothetical protein